MHQLKELGERRRWHDEIPVPGNIALKILRNDTLSHIDFAVNRMLRAIETLAGIRRDIMDRHQRQTQILAEESEEIRAIQQGKLGDSIKEPGCEILPEHVAPLKQLYERVRVHEQALGEGIEQNKQTVARLEQLSDKLRKIDKAFRPLRTKAMAAYFFTSLAASGLAIGMIATECVLAYSIARWISPTIKQYVPLEAAVLILFIAQYFALKPTVSRGKEYLYWSVYSHTLHSLAAMIEKLDTTLVAIDEMWEQSPVGQVAS